MSVQFTFLQDDIGVPLNYRHMEGFGVHTYTLINKEGRVTYVKFHWQPALGECLWPYFFAELSLRHLLALLGEISGLSLVISA